MSQTTEKPNPRKPGSSNEELPPLPKTRAFDREAKVGLFVIGSVAGILIALFTLTDASMFRGRYILHTRVDDARGVRKGDPIVLRGVNIGRVQKFDIDKSGANQTAVNIFMEIEGEYKVPKDSFVEIRSASLIQGMVVAIDPGTSNEAAKQGDELQHRVASAPNLMDQASAVAVKAEDTLKRVDRLMSDTTITNVETGTTELNAALRTLNATIVEQRKSFANLTASLQRSADSAEKLVARPELDRAITRLDTVTAQMEELTQSFKRTSATMESFVTRIDKGEGTIGKLSKDEELYTNLNSSIKSLNSTATELSQLSADIRKNPKKYFKFSVF